MTAPVFYFFVVVVICVCVCVCVCVSKAWEEEPWFTACCQGVSDGQMSASS